MPEFEVEIRTDPVLTTAGPQSNGPEVAYDLHDWPDELPQHDETITVAVMDSGIHEEQVENHPWFEGVEVAKRYDAAGDSPGNDAVGHGTGVASIISKNATELAGILGVDDLGIEFYDVRIFGDSGRSGMTTILKAYKWLLDHADEIDIVNMSWGARGNVSQINQVHEKLIARGVHDVVAAGNTGEDGGSPATSREAFSAGAVDGNGEPARFSSLDPDRGNPDVSALGVDCKMARASGTNMGEPLDDEFTKASGTSFASPYTAAAYVIGMYAKQGSWDERFIETAPDIPGSEQDGGGLLKLGGALDGEMPDDPNPTYDAATWDISGDVVWFSGDVLPKSLSTRVEVLDDTDEHTDLRVHK